MQTFLTQRNFNLSLQQLDTKRLGKQRVEAFQLWLLNNKLAPTGNFVRWLDGYVSRSGKENLLKPSTGWQNHPAALMWRGYEDLLGAYLNTSIKVWVGRGYNNTMEFVPTNTVYDSIPADDISFGILNSFAQPVWLKDMEYSERLFSSHRSNLLRKNPEHYSQFGWDEPNDLEYLWPKSGYVI